MTAVNQERVLSELEWKDDSEIFHLCDEDTEKLFATVIGCIENTVMDDDFISLQAQFMEKHYNEFDENEENKLIYTDIFKTYLETIEKHIEEQLIKNIPNFNMQSFEIELQTRRNELEGEIFDMLSTFSDFKSFKNMFLDYKAMKEGKYIDFSNDISITKLSVNPETTEQTTMEV